MVSNGPHIIIIGAGLIGLSTADALLTRGAKVTILEARPGPCEGTSFSNSGMIHPSQAKSWQNLDDETYILDAARVTADLGKLSASILKSQGLTYKTFNKSSPEYITSLKDKDKKGELAKKIKKIKLIVNNV